MELSLDGVLFSTQIDVSADFIGPHSKMAASLLTRCAAHSTRSFLTKVSRRACLLCTKPTDGQKDTVQHQKNQTVEKGSESSAGERALAGFAKALEKAKIVPEDDVADDLQTTETEHTTFAAMLRHSKLVQLGDVTGRMVMGTVVEVVGDDLYIDLGGKFHCVCSRPKLNSE